MNNKTFAETDSSGNYFFDSLTIGKTYKFTFMALGYTELKKSFLVTKPVDTLNLVLNANCEFDSKQAEMDIENKTPKLLLIGSIAPTSNSKNDLKFEKKYKLQYFDFGCTPPGKDCVLEYNKRIFIYLDQTFGLEWRKGVRTDVIGLKN